MLNLNKHIVFFLFVLLIVSFSNISAQYENHSFSIAGYYNYTVTSSLFSNPRHADDWVRGYYQSIDYLPSYSVDIRYRISESVIVGLGLEYMKSTTVFNPVEGIAPDGPVTIAAEDGYELFPLELTVFYYLPFSSEEFKFFMGGGVGIYTGNINRDVSGVGVSTVERKYDVGLNVIVGADYMVLDYLAIRGQLKFRDPDFEVKSEYNEASTVVDDETILIRNNSFYSRINVDGIIFTLGAALFF